MWEMGDKPNNLEMADNAQQYEAWEISPNNLKMEDYAQQFEDGRYCIF